MNDLSPNPRIGYQGVPGAYSEEALLAFSPTAERVSHRTLVDLFAALAAGEIDRAFVPIENSHAGSVVEAYDHLLDNDVTVEAEWLHPVNHCLLAVEGATPADIERVFSHPQALAQTRKYLSEAQLTAEPYYDTAGAAEMVAERRDPRLAAVAGRLAGERYGLTILADGIQTAADNATRFFLLARGTWKPSSESAPESDRQNTGRTTLIFSVEHRPGALVRALSCFSHRQVSLDRLESRPSRRSPWEYMFFTDVQGYADEPRVAAALRELTRLNPMVRVLGSYPAAERLDLVSPNGR
ncbi:MAG TPA: prephenate dehydratase [Chloroflexota bacterium]|nr:prephenate dehydratase [Chloroflexota bacterium]